MSSVIWSAPSLADLDRIYDFIAERDADAAFRVVDDIAQQVNRRLAAHAFAGPPAGPERLRKLSILQLPYVVLYRVERGQVRISRVRHAAEDWSL